MTDDRCRTHGTKLALSWNDFRIGCAPRDLDEIVEHVISSSPFSGGASQDSTGHCGVPILVSMVDQKRDRIEALAACCASVRTVTRLRRFRASEEGAMRFGGVVDLVAERGHEPRKSLICGASGPYGGIVEIVNGSLADGIPIQIRVHRRGGQLNDVHYAPIGCFWGDARVG